MRRKGDAKYRDRSSSSTSKKCSQTKKVLRVASGVDIGSSEWRERRQRFYYYIVSNRILLLFWIWNQW